MRVVIPDSLGASRTGLCFGGPLNERMATIDDGHSHMRAAMPRKVSEYRAYDPIAPIAPIADLRIVTYEWMKVAFRNVEYGCWIADGFPRQRIIDAMNALAILVSLPLTMKLPNEGA